MEQKTLKVKRAGVLGQGTNMQTYINKTGGGINYQSVYTPPYLKQRHTNPQTALVTSTQ